MPSANTNGLRVSNIKEAVDWLFSKFQTLTAKDIEQTAVAIPDKEKSSVDDALDLFGKILSGQIPSDITFPSITWYDLPLLNGATTVPAYAIRYGKLGTIVFIEGMLIPNSTAHNFHFSTLPEGYRPSRFNGYIGVPESQAASARNVTLTTTGGMQIQNPFGGGTAGATDRLYVSISFPV